MKFAILGCGSIGQRHIKNLLALGESDLVAFEPDTTRHATLRQAYDVPIYGQLDEIWSHDPDVVLVTAPTHQHLDLAVEATHRGCHLFVEKPLAHTNAGLGTLLNQSRDHRCITLVGCNMRFHPGPQMLKSLLESGRIGRPISARLHTGSFMPEWRPGTDYRTVYSASPEQGGGAIFDQIHEIDLAFWLFGPIAQVESMVVEAGWLDIQVEGLAEILAQHCSGLLSSIHLNFVQRDYQRNIQIIGESGSLYWDFVTSEIKIYDAHKSEYENVRTDKDWQINDMYVAEMKHFIDCLHQHKPTICPVEQGAAVLETALAVKQAATAQKAQKVGGKV